MIFEISAKIVSKSRRNHYFPKSGVISECFWSDSPEFLFEWFFGVELFRSDFGVIVGVFCWSGFWSGAISE